MDRTVQSDSSLQRLEQKHRDLSAQLERLQEQRFLTDEEKLEEVRIKKQKLALKDRMEAARRAGADPPPPFAPNRRRRIDEYHGT